MSDTQKSFRSLEISPTKYSFFNPSSNLLPSNQAPVCGNAPFVVTRVTSARARFAARVRDPAKFVLAPLRANGGTNCKVRRGTVA